MRNANWVCYSCRTNVRRSAYARDNLVTRAKCPSCAATCEFIGDTEPIPPRSNPKAWLDLRAKIGNRKAQTDRIIEAGKARIIDEYKTEIRRLEALPANDGRTAAVKLLRKQLDRFVARGTVSVRGLMWRH